jgi:hypothetical protein
MSIGFVTMVTVSVSYHLNLENLTALHADSRSFFCDIMPQEVMFTLSTT